MAGFLIYFISFHGPLSDSCVLVSSTFYSRILTELRKSNRLPQIMEYVSSKNEGLMTAALTFVNAIIGATSDTQSRVEIRNEFLKMNIREVVNKERMDPSESLTVQIRAFKMGADEDLDTLIKAGAISAVPTAAAPTNEAMQEKVTKLETQVKSLEFEIGVLREENDRLKKAAAAGPAVSAATPTGGAPPAPSADGSSIPAAPAVVGEGAPPPPPAPGAEGGAPPPPPPPGGDGGGGPPPPPPPPGGGPPPPPPPPGGGPPGPPPPPGAPAAPAAPKRPAKAKCKPNRKMRAFQWTKIADAKIDNTIWDKTNDNRVKLDTLELESLFGVVEASAASGAKTPRESVGALGASQVTKKAPTVQLLDPKRANNCEIMLRGLKMEPSAIRAAIMSMDEKVLTEDTLKTMKEYVPLPEEIQVLKDYTGDKKQLGRAEQYFLAVMDIPKLSARLTAMAFKAGFNERSENCKSDIHTLSTAINSVKNSQHLFQLLELVLAIGNYLNGTGNAGGCYGFRINSLNKMMDVKSSDGKMSLIHYLYDLVSKKHKELLAINNELSACAEASRLNIRETMAHVAELKTGFASVDALLNDPSVDSTFTKTMGPFASSAKSTIEQLDNRGSTLEPKFKECVTFYGEPASTEPEDFFGAINNFLESFARAKSDNEKRAAAAAKEAQSKALLAAVQAKQVGKKNQKGQLDDAIEGMKNGTMFARVSVHMQGPPKF